MSAQRICPICSAQEPEVVATTPASPGAVTLARCAVCRYVFRLPAGTYEEGALPMPGGELLARRLAAVENAVPRGALLDLDSCDGAFLALARRQGWRVAGIAPGPTAKRDHGLPPELLRETLEEGHWLAGSFDAIICWTPLEHNAQPDTLVRLAAHYCRIDGVLMLHAQATHRGGTESTFSPDRRYPPSAVFRLLNRYGFRIERLEREPHAGRIPVRAGHAVLFRGGTHPAFQPRRVPVASGQETTGLLVTARYIP